MTFVTLCTIRSGKFKEAVRMAKEFEAPSGIKLIANYGLAGRYDGILVFEAPDEATAMGLIAKLQDTLQTETFLAMPLKEVAEKLV